MLGDTISLEVNLGDLHELHRQLMQCVFPQTGLRRIVSLPCGSSLLGSARLVAGCGNGRLWASEQVSWPSLDGVAAICSDTRSEHDSQYDAVKREIDASLSRMRFDRSIQTIRLVRLAVSTFLDSQIAASTTFVQRRQTSLSASHPGGRSRNWSHHLFTPKICQSIVVQVYTKHPKVNWKESRKFKNDLVSPWGCKPRVTGDMEALIDAIIALDSPGISTTAWSIPPEFQISMPPEQPAYTKPFWSHFTLAGIPVVGTAKTRLLVRKGESALIITSKA